jgi:hypothetical protein
MSHVVIGQSVASRVIDNCFLRKANGDRYSGTACWGEILNLFIVDVGGGLVSGALGADFVDKFNKRDGGANATSTEDLMRQLGVTITDEGKDDSMGIFNATRFRVDHADGPSYHHHSNGTSGVLHFGGMGPLSRRDELSGYYTFGGAAGVKFSYCGKCTGAKLDITNPAVGRSVSDMCYQAAGADWSDVADFRVSNGLDCISGDAILARVVFEQDNFGHGYEGCPSGIACNCDREL